MSVTSNRRLKPGPPTQAPARSALLSASISPAVPIDAVPSSAGIATLITAAECTAGVMTGGLDLADAARNLSDSPLTRVEAVGLPSLSSQHAAT